MANNGGRKRLNTLVIVVLVALNLIIYGGIFVMSKRSGGNSPKPTSLPPVKLYDTYVQSLTVAKAWQQDAYLTSVTRSWQLSKGEQLTLYRPTWAFGFYSPTTGQIQSVSVNRSGAQSGRTQTTTNVPRHAQADWALDSDDLLLTFLSYGGQDFINKHPSLNLHLQLKGQDNGSSVWYFTAVDPISRETFVIGIDAQTHQVISGKDDQGG